MLGLGPVSSRSVSGSPFKLTQVPLYAIATGALLTFGGITHPGFTLELSANGALVTLGGTASGFWLQNATTTGTFLTISGSATGRLLGSPIIFTATPENLTFTAQAERFLFNAQTDSHKFYGSR